MLPIDRLRTVYRSDVDRSFIGGVPRPPSPRAPESNRTVFAAAEAGAPRIFSHKGGLLQEAPPFALEAPGAWPRAPAPPPAPWPQQQTSNDPTLSP